MKIRVDWAWMKRGGKWLDRFDLSDLLYRGVYDSDWDTTPGMRTQRTFQGEKVDRRFDDIDDFSRGARDAFKFENVLREAYEPLPSGQLRPEPDRQKPVRHPLQRVAGADTPILPEGLQLQLGYLYQRFAASGGASSSAVVARGIPPTEAGVTQTAELVRRQTLPVEFYAPYIHTIGIAANHFDEWTKVVWRMEQAYDFGLPFYSCGHNPNAIANQGRCVRETTYSPFLPGIRNHDV
jgi:hypothetical protein